MSTLDTVKSYADRTASAQKIATKGTIHDLPLKGILVFTRKQSCRNFPQNAGTQKPEEYRARHGLNVGTGNISVMSHSS